MITLRRIEGPVTLPCPYCAAPLVIFDLQQRHPTFNGKSAGEPEFVPGFDEALTPEQAAPNGFQALLEAGRGTCCKKSFFLVEAVMVNRNLNPEANPADDAFVADFFFLNGKDAPAALLMASRGKRDWLVQQFESPLGPVLHHYFGPLPWIERTVTGPDGTEQGDRGRGNWAYARRILLALWDELRALSASI